MSLSGTNSASAAADPAPWPSNTKCVVSGPSYPHKMNASPGVFRKSASATCTASSMGSILLRRVCAASSCAAPVDRGVKSLELYAAIH